MGNKMHELGIRIVKDHRITLPDPHLILCKASTTKDKFGEYAFGMDYERMLKLKDKTYIVHVDVRTKTIGAEWLDNLMKPFGDFPVIENTNGIGRCIYWSSHSLDTLAKLTEAEVDEIIALRTQRKFPNQTNLF